MQVDELTWTPDPDLDPGVGEVATARGHRLGVWTDPMGVTHFDIFEIASDSEVIEGAVYLCDGDPRALARTLAVSTLSLHLARKAN